jgi:hypothetical protein
VVLTAGPLPAQSHDLRAQDGPIEGLTQDDLDVVLEPRGRCSEIVEFVDSLAHLFHDATEGRRQPAFRGAFADARVGYGGKEGQCRVAISELPAGWPRDVMGEEVVQIERLFESLYEAMEAFATKQPPDVVNRRIEAYEAMLVRWVAWIDLSQRFWAGEYLVQRRRTCLAHQAEDAAEVRSLLMHQVVRAQEARDLDLLDLAQAKIDAAPDAMQDCRSMSDLEALELRLLAETFTAYGALLTAIRNNDDQAIRTAMGREREVSQGGARCRGEHRRGEVSEACLP